MRGKYILLGSAIVSMGTGTIYAAKKLYDKVIDIKVKEAIAAYKTEETEILNEIPYDEYHHYIVLMRDVVTGTKEWQSLTKKEKKIVEAMIYDKVRNLPSDPHLNSDSCFWLRNLGRFVRDNNGIQRIRENLKDMAKAHILPEWAVIELF